MATSINATYINDGTDIPIIDDETAMYLPSELAVVISATTIVDSIIAPGTRPSTGVIYPRGLAD